MRVYCPFCAEYVLTSETHSYATHVAYRCSGATDANKAAYKSLLNPRWPYGGVR